MIVASVPVKSPVPIEVVETSCLLGSRASRVEALWPVSHCVAVVRSVVLAPPAAVKSPPETVEEADERKPVLLQRLEVALAHVTKPASLVKSFRVMSVRFRSSSAMVPSVMSAVPTEAHVATPAPFSARTNWLVQVVPAYSWSEPSAAAKGSALVMEVIAKVVEVPFVSVMFWKALVPLHVLLFARIVEEAAVTVMWIA